MKNKRTDDKIQKKKLEKQKNENELWKVLARVENGRVGFLHNFENEQTMQI